MAEDHTSLIRKLGFFPATNIVIANMIGAGIFTASGLLLAGLHDPVLMLGLWLAGGIIAFCGALSYSELGAAMPEAGGEYFFLSRVFHPVFGFLSGWVSFIVGFSAPIAASAIGLVLVIIAGAAFLLTVINLAIKGFGAPFYIALSRKLAADWMYAWTRNPMALAALALFLSLGIWFQSALFLLWVLIVFAPAYVFFAKVYEERELEIRFGASMLIKLPI